MSARTTPDLLELAESVVAGRVGRAQADATVRDRGGRDVDGRLAELDSLVLAAAAMDRHAVAHGRAGIGAHAAARAGAVTAADQRSVGAWQGSARSGGEAREIATGPVRGATTGTVRGHGGALAGLAMAGVAVIILGVVLSGTVRIPSSAGPPPTPRDVRSLTTLVTADAAIPPTGDSQLRGAPRAAFWSLLSPDRVAVWAWTSGESLTKLAEVDAWADPTGTPPGGLGSVQRTLLVAPDGRRFAFAEVTGSGVLRGRLRVFDIGGSLSWELGGTAADGIGSGAPIAFAWSPDGRRLAVESASWDLVSFDDAGRATSRRLDATIPAENAYGLIGFSGDGSRIFGWETGGEAEWWQRPVAVDVASGTLTTLAEFPADALAGVGSSNATFPLERIAGGSGAALAQPLLAKGDLAWAAVRGSASVPIATWGSPADADPRWGPDGRAVVVARRAADDAASVPAARVSIAAPGATGTSRDLFTFGPGAYDVATGGVSGDFVLCLAAATHGAIGGAALGYDEAVLIRIGDGATSVLAAPGRSAEDGGLTFGGWLSGP